MFRENCAGNFRRFVHSHVLLPLIILSVCVLSASSQNYFNCSLIVVFVDLIALPGNLWDAEFAKYHAIECRKFRQLQTNCVMYAATTWLLRDWYFDCSQLRARIRDWKFCKIIGRSYARENRPMQIGIKYLYSLSTIFWW